MSETGRIIPDDSLKCLQPEISDSKPRSLDTNVAMLKRSIIFDSSQRVFDRSVELRNQSFEVGTLLKRGRSVAEANS